MSTRAYPASAINEALMLIRNASGHFSIEGNQKVDEGKLTLESRTQAGNTREEYGQLEIHNVLAGASDATPPILKNRVKPFRKSAKSPPDKSLKPSAYVWKPSSKNL